MLRWFHYFGSTHANVKFSQIYPPKVTPPDQSPTYPKSLLKARVKMTDEVFVMENICVTDRVSEKGGKVPPRGDNYGDLHIQPED